MKIRQLIEALERYEKESDQGENTEVKIQLHVQEWNTSGFYTELPIEDVCIAYIGPDLVQIEGVVSNHDILDINTKMNKLNKIKFG